MNNAVGQVLRSARERRGWTLRQVQAKSAGRFKPSALGGYERGERSISLERFCDLARLYGVPPDRLLAEVFTTSSEEMPRLVIDLNRLPLAPGGEGKALAEFTHRVKGQRGDYVTDVLTLRAGDLEALALEHDLGVEELSRAVVSALRST